MYLQDALLDQVGRLTHLLTSGQPMPLAMQQVLLALVGDWCPACIPVIRSSDKWLASEFGVAAEGWCCVCAA